MSLEIVLTGSELLLGEIVDTNSVMVSKMLREIGVDVLFKTTVGDDEQHITDVLEIALSRTDFVIVSGGLGPTVDDRTRQAVAVATNRELIYSLELEAQIAARFKSFGREMSENNKRQAWIPENSIPVENPVGTAPCFIVEDERGTVICLPGVPRELKYQMENAIIPYLRERVGAAQMIKARTLRTCAIGESMVDHAIDDLMRLDNPAVGLAAHPAQVDIRITAKAATEAEADALIAPVEAEVRKRLGDSIFGVDEDTLADVVGQLLDKHGVNVAVIDTMAEGAIGKALTEAEYGRHIASEVVFDSPEAAQAQFNLTAQDLKAGEATAISLAKRVRGTSQIGVCILGPISLDEDELISFVALAYGDNVEVRDLRLAYGRQVRLPWIITQALDLIWRQVRN